MSFTKNITVARDDIERRITPFAIDRTKYPLVLVGIRGFQSPDANKRGVYDDAIVLLTESVCTGFRANTDPSRTGLNTKVNKGMASLKPGVYPSYRFDTHNGSHPHPAICQRAGVVTVTRDGGKEESGWFGVNIHRGGYNSTSSEGCQTLHPDEWDIFYPAAKAQAITLWGDNWKKNTVLYVLIEA